MTVAKREGPDWAKLPVALQHQFFMRAEEEAGRCKHRLIERHRRLEELKRFIDTQPIPEGDEWSGWRVAVIDGSNSPSTSERLGGRFGTYCAGYLVFEGTQLADEGYTSGYLSHEQMGDPDVTQKVLAMLRFRLEREAALHCLEEKDVDLVLLDGSFFGFRAQAHLIKNEELPLEGFGTGMDLIGDVRDKSLKLLRSHRVVGVIKRTRTSALDGWLTYRFGDEGRCINTNDKHILSAVIPVGRWFAYEWLFGSSTAFNYFNRFRDTYRFLVLKERRTKDPEKVLDAARRKVHTDVKRALDIGGETVLRTSRYYIRCSNASPFEFEAHVATDAKPLLAYFKAFHNPATGLPWPIDLVDQNASLPRGFNREFVEEIEARLIRDPEVGDKLALQEYFSYLNPQKEED